VAGNDRDHGEPIGITVSFRFTKLVNQSVAVVKCVVVVVAERIS